MRYNFYNDTKNRNSGKTIKNILNSIKHILNSIKHILNIIKHILNSIKNILNSLKNILNSLKNKSKPGDIMISGNRYLSHIALGGWRFR